MRLATLAQQIDSLDSWFNQIAVNDHPEALNVGRRARSQTRLTYQAQPERISLACLLENSPVTRFVMLCRREFVEARSCPVALPGSVPSVQFAAVDRTSHWPIGCNEPGARPYRLSD